MDGGGSKADKGTRSILLSLKIQTRILWGWFWILPGMLGSCKFTPHLEIRRLPSCLHFQNLMAKPFLNDFSRRVFIGFVTTS